MNSKLLFVCLLLGSFFRAAAADWAMLYNRTGGCLKVLAMEEYFACDQETVIGYYGGDGIFVKDEHGDELFVSEAEFGGTELTILRIDGVLVWVEGNVVLNPGLDVDSASDKRKKGKRVK